MKRIFLGLPLAPLFRQETETFLETAGRDPSVKWIKAEQLHVTLHFFGDTADEEIEKICRIASEAAAASSPVRLALEGIGYFPSEEKKRIVWIPLRGDMDALMNLQAALAAGLRAEGYAVEDRPFVPHATVGRVRRGERRTRGNEPPAPAFPATAEKTVTEIILYESKLTPQGPVYDTLAAFSLGGPAKA